MKQPASPRHAAKVVAIQAVIRQARHNGQPVRMYHGATNSTRPRLAGVAAIDVSGLSEIIEINHKAACAWVEPNVPFDRLVDAVAPFGLMPPVVPEFPGITLGGAIQGGSGESSSFKYGGVHETCPAYELVLGNGDVKLVSAHSDRELYDGTACAFGSLGVVTLVKIQLVATKRYVRLRYQRADSIDAAIQLTQAAVRQPVDFVDGIVFSKTHSVVMTGQFSDEVDLPTAAFRSAFDDWFYLHAEKVSASQAVYEELIPLRDYLFRYDRGAFWTAKYGFAPVPFNRLTRTLFAPFFKTRTLFKLLHASGYAYEYMTQDLCMPQESIGQLINFCNRHYDIMPLWLCPLRPGGPDKLSPTALKTELVINLGLWGPMKPAELAARERNRQLEREVARLGGRKVLYAHAYYPETEFWQLYDKLYYDELRRLTASETVFPNLYQKILTPPLTFRPSRRRGLRGLFKT